MEILDDNWDEWLRTQLASCCHLLIDGFLYDPGRLQVEWERRKKRIAQRTCLGVFANSTPKFIGDAVIESSCAEPVATLMQIGVLGIAAMLHHALFQQLQPMEMLGTYAKTPPMC